MKSCMLRLPSLRPKTRRGRWQSGQSIIVLAIGFIALLGFVGIVTDVSLLFVRYSSLSRAVDAAAVAAAGQMRRVPDDAAAGVNGEAASVAQLGLAARQFIEVYGLNPSTVLVETCRVQRYRDTSGNPVDRNGAPLFLGDGSINPAAVQDDVDRFQALCTTSEEKLVRVTAQIDAPTTFLSLLGYRTVTLTVDAISQTAVLDVALIFDVSEAMLSETQYSDWQEAGYGWRYLPPRYNQIRTQAAAMAGVGDPDWIGCWNWSFIVTQSQADITASGFNATRPDGTTYPCPSSLYNVENTNPALNTNYAGYNFPTPYRWLPEGVDPLTQQEPPVQACRVRIWPESAYNRYTILNQWLADEYIKNTGSDPAPFATEADLRAYFENPSNSVTLSTFHGFVPTFNYYGCCNDPNGDWDFSDLVCQPFGEARDAAQGFLDRLDFLRGDRIAYITYDRRATVIDPDGAAGGQIPMMESQNNITDGVGNVVRRGAEEVLNQVIGVRAETTFYDDTDHNGVWDCIYAGTSVGGAGECLANLDSIQNETIYGITNHPVKGACPFDMVAMDAQYTGPYGQYRWDQGSSSFVDRSQSYFSNDTPLDDITTNMTGGFPSWALTVASAPYRNYAYEFRASCAGGNVGGALGAASNMLYLNGRREGAVWLMVLLSSGASGASDPMGRFTVHGDVDASHLDGLWGTYSRTEVWCPEQSFQHWHIAY
ncbi:MAG: pilus assembly protein TadG-related protein [Anaerolineae bacterium]